MGSPTILLLGPAILGVLAPRCLRVLFGCHWRFWLHPVWISWCNLHLQTCWHLIESCAAVHCLCWFLHLMDKLCLFRGLCDLSYGHLKYFCWWDSCADKGVVYPSTIWCCSKVCKNEWHLATKNVLFDSLYLFLIFFLLYVMSLHCCIFCCLVGGFISLSCGFSYVYLTCIYYLPKFFEYSNCMVSRIRYRVLSGVFVLF